ncbi:MAG: Gfo/Idh/MocA family oxidoreductase, partial [Blautia sp.]|nr:Gfo/Idh/MocA family oxidoreductase [Blautia sp.]
VEEAEEILELAKEKGVIVGSAPDTFLTSSMQSGRKLLEDGWIGKPLYVTANMMSCGVELWHPNPSPFYQNGGGPLYDMAPYYLSVLIHLFGPVQEVFAYCEKGYETRKIYTGPQQGKTVEVTVPTHYTSVLRMANGVLVNMNMSFDIWHSTLPKMEIYGTEGTLTMPDPNNSDGKASVFRKEQIVAKAFQMPEDIQAYEVPQRVQNVSEYTRGTGVAEMVVSIQKGRKHRANGELALHIIEAINGMMESAACGKCYKMRSTCEQPPLWNWMEECM